MLPKEHGGTVMLAASLVAGSVVSGRLTVPLLGVAIAVAGAHLCREPVVRLLRFGRNLPRRTRRQDLLVVVISGGVAAVGAGAVAASVPVADLAMLAIPGTLLGAGIIAAGARRQGRALPVEAAGTLVACLAAPAAVLAATGKLGAPAAAAFAACVLFFVGAMLHLRAVVRRRRDLRRGLPVRGRPWFWSVASVALAWALAPLGGLFVAGAAATSVAILRPVVLRGKVLLRPTRVGIAETVLAAAFVAILAVAVR